MSTIRVINALRNFASSRGGQKVLAGAAATATVATGVYGFKEATDTVEITSNSQSQDPKTPPIEEVNLRKNQLGIIKFPLDLEDAPVPHVLIKIFETQTGQIEPTDTSTIALVSGTQQAIKKADELNLATAAGAAAGARAAVTPAVLLALGKQYSAAVSVLAAGGIAGAAIVGTGAAGAAAEAATDFAGQLLGIDNTASRMKNLIGNFALKRNTQQLSLAIAMLMPENLAVSYTNTFDALSLTTAAGGYGQIAQALGSNLGGAGEQADPYIIEAMGTLAGSALTEEFKRIGLFATTGRTINPQPEMIYNSPELRQFTMDFRLVPRNKTEAQQIKVLINQLKYFSSPQIPPNTGGRFFIPPAQFEIEFYDSENNQNQFLFKTKKCVLEDISLDFTGGASGYTSFYDGSPVETRLSLRFKETVFIDREAVQKGY